MSMKDEDDINECPYCEDEIEQDDFMLRWRGKWHHPECAREAAEVEGEVWRANHPLTREVTATITIELREDHPLLEASTLVLGNDSDEVVLERNKDGFTVVEERSA